MRKKLIILFLIAFFLRLIALNQSFWLDETITANTVKNFSFLGIMSQFSPFDFHPPLYYLLMKLWSMVFGYSEIALRFPSIIFSLLTGWFVFLIGKKLKNEETGFWATTFFLLNPLIIYYSQEARMYITATFLTTVLLYFFLKIEKIVKKLQTQMSNVKSQNYKSKLKIDLLFLYLFTLLSLLTFYGSIFLIAAFLFYLLYQKRYKLLFFFILSVLFFLLILSPLLYQQLLHSKEILKTVPNWSNVLGRANLKNLLLIPLKFSFGRISFFPREIFYSISAIWTLLVMFFVGKGGIKNRPLLFLFLLPPFLGLLFSFFSPLLQYFRFLYLIPIMSLLLVFGAQNRWQKLILILGFSLLSLIYLLNPNFHREDWKALSKSLPKNTPVYMILPSSDPIKYYQPDLVFRDLRTLAVSCEREIIVIPYTAEIYGFDYQSYLKKNNFSLTKSENFRGLLLEFWGRN